MFWNIIKVSKIFPKEKRLLKLTFEDGLQGTYTLPKNVCTGVFTPVVSDDNFYNVCIKYGVLVWENKQQNYYLDVAPEPIYFGIKNSPNNHFDAD